MIILNIIIIICFNLFVINAWEQPLDYKLNSWKNKKISQIPEYKDNKKFDKVMSELKNFSPIVFAGECDILKDSIANACFGKNFILIGGDCAEEFDKFNVDNVRDTYRLILQMSMIFTYGSGLPTIKIARIAGQFAKPRSDEYEKYLDKSVLTYRGDIINGYDLSEREPDPDRMISAYHQSVQTLNILRAFGSGGYANVNRVNSWILDFAEKTETGSKYRNFAKDVTKSLKFVNGLGININSDKFTQTYLYTAHECLLLPYEEALTRIDSRKNIYYDCSAHLVWLGERTRQLDSAHVEFLRGINNPIGIKISQNINADELVQLLKILNPNNTPGRILLMTRMGEKNIANVLPNLIKKIKNDDLFVTWCCDPMHANTIKTIGGIKTRNLDSIKNEITEYFKIHKKMKTFPGGVHLELTPTNVTECIGGNINNIKELDLIKKYDSKCDPRLNYFQSLELSFLISDLLSE